MFIRYLVSITQVLKDTEFGLFYRCEYGNYYYFIQLHHTQTGIQTQVPLSLRGGTTDMLRVGTTVYIDLTLSPPAGAMKCLL
jgi:hypothetical protein